MLKDFLKNLKQEYKERVNPETTGEIAKKVQKYASGVFVVSSLIIAAPITLPATVVTWLSYVTLVSGVVSGRAGLNKSKLKK